MLSLRLHAHSGSQMGADDHKGGCNVGSVVMGNIRIAEEILNRKPESTVVLNLLMPRKGTYRDEFAEINRRLACYASETERVEYFNGTDLFVTSAGELNHELFVDGIHPNEQGSIVWGSAIAERVETIVHSSEE